MNSKKDKTSHQDSLAFLSGGGEMGERIRTFDWANTPLGPVSGWSPALHTMLSIMLANRFPHILWWGSHYIQFYNDPYRPIPGIKHPDRALGRPASECWAEIWNVIGPLIDRPFNGGPATWDDDIYLEINRHGFVEECHFTIAYSPVPDETVPSGIGGVLATVHEITGKVVGDRRVLVLRDLGSQSAEARTAEDACARATRTLANHSKDIPFALLYLIDPDRKQAHLAGSAGVAAGGLASPSVIPLEGDDANNPLWPLGQVMQSENVQVVKDLPDRLRDQVPPGPWTDRPHTSAVIPIRSNKAHYLAGFLVAGISARLQFDQPYHDFLELISSQISTAIANAREYEAEKKRAEALAEIDRAKTAFFNNVSHEFRTPLTLMLGPVEDLLATSHTGLSPAAKGQLEVVDRNGLRLLRLVNTLLDFSRIEAGRVHAVFEPTDLAAFTAELASVFRAATERAGLRLSVNCPRLSEPVYVDRDMWEKVVLNLVSNAFKFTFEGEIEVSLRAVDGAAELRVRDTGVGIPAEEMPRLFERFHRIQNMRSRTHEGSGIGLALVQELVKLHGGTVRAESKLNIGATFIVNVPLGKDHLPPEHISGRRNLASTAFGAAPFVEEALHWLPEQPAIEDAIEFVPNELLPVPCPPHETEKLPWIFVVDDNADMRQYLARILAEHYNVQTFPDGQAALDAARERQPDLILSDVMMPHLDGFGLVREIRADTFLKTVPIILLSARAGEESRVEGLEQGADDYLIKPFSTRELIARVAAHLDMARLRKEASEQIRQSEERFRAFVTASSEVVYRMSPDWSEMLQLDGRGFLANTEKPSRTWLNEYTSPEDQSHVIDVINEAIRTKSIFELEHRVLRADGSLGWVFSRAVPLMDANDEIVEWFGTTSDITKRKQAEEALRDSKATLEAAIESMNDAVFISNVEGDFIDFNEAFVKFHKFRSKKECYRKFSKYTDYFEGYLPDGTLVPTDMWPVQRALRGETATDTELIVRRKDTGETWIASYNFAPIRNKDGAIIGSVVTARDITERKQAEEELTTAHSQIQSIIDNTPDIVYTFDLEERFVLANKAVANVLNSTPDQMIGKRRHEFMPKTDADWHEANDRQVFEAGRVLEFEEYSHLESRSITWLTKKFPLRDAQGRIYAVGGISADITEQKKAEDALKEARDSLEVKVKERTADLEEAYNLLQENERRLSEAQKLSHIGSWDWNIVTNELNWSDETYLIFGRDLQQFGSTHDAFLSYVHPDDRNYVDSAVKGAIKGKPYDIDYRIILADGSERIVHSQGGAIFSEENTPLRMRGTVQDITERKQAEEELYKNQELLRGIIDNTPALIYVLDLEERITVANRALAYLFGKTSEELIGRTRHGLMPEETALRDEENDRKVMAYGHFMEFEEHGIFNGMPKTYFTVKFPIRDTKGKIHSIAGISTDITERKKSEKALENFEIARKKEIHHRIKNNLQVISSLLDLQADKFNGRKDIQDSDVLEAFRESQDRVISMALIHEELYKGKTFKGKGFESVGFETLNFSPYIEKLAENLFLTYRLGNTDISLNMELEDDLFFNMDTAVPLGMIVNELVSNSLKHAFPGRDEGEIRIKLNRVEIEDCDSTSFILSISDNGIGIPENLEIEDLDSLGMQLVTALVDQLDGELELKRNNGTEFIMRFMVTENNNQASTPAPQQLIE